MLLLLILKDAFTLIYCVVLRRQLAQHRLAYSMKSSCSDVKKRMMGVMQI